MKPLPDDDCGLSTALNAIGGKWKTHILWELNLKPWRFGELKRLLPGVSEKVLAQQLKEMEADGLVRREEFPGKVLKVEYSVTELGVTLNTAITTLSEWGKNQRSRMERACAENN